MEDGRILSIRGLSKSFPGTLALDKVSFDVYRGEVHAITGESGAGKSTLAKIISGVIKKDEGELLLNGSPYKPRNPKQARRSGIGMIYQELSMAPNLTVAENIIATHVNMNTLLPMKTQSISDETLRMLQSFGIDSRTLVRNLPIGLRKMAECAGVLSSTCSVVILDEPTASLSEKDTLTLFKIVNSLKKKGKTVIYITHKIEEIFHIADNITVIKDGVYVGTIAAAVCTPDRLMTMMMGYRMEENYPPKAKDTGRCMLETINLGGNGFNSVNLRIRAGEILGVAGLPDSGKTELFSAIFGLHNIENGAVIIDGQSVEISRPSDAIAGGLGYVPEARENTSLFMKMSVFDNAVAVPSVHKRFEWNAKELDGKAAAMLQRVGAKMPTLRERISRLSGGNRQKALIARWLLAGVRILIMDEPTRGMDVGSKRELYALLRELANEGMSFVIISTEMPEIIGMSDRIIVMYKGKITTELEHEEGMEQKILSAMMGARQLVPGVTYSSMPRSGRTGAKAKETQQR